MEISRVKFALALLSCFTLAFASGYAIQNFAFDRHQPMVASANVRITIQTEAGVRDLMIGNLITDFGENATRYGCAGVAVDVKYIAVGNSTIDQTKTKLDTEYTRVLGDRTFWISNGDYAFNVTKKITFTETVTLNAAALHCSSTANANDAYAMASFTQTTFQNNWNLTITWIVVYNGN